MESKHAQDDACLHRDFTDLYDYPKTETGTSLS
jgi:hypothetical protein